MQSFTIEIVDAAFKSPFRLAFVRLKKSNSLGYIISKFELNVLLLLGYLKDFLFLSKLHEK
jgi:hypothetical protein